MKLGTAQILRGNALDLPIADATVDLIVTSPPYFSLRSYQDGGEHYDGQIGSEATPAEFVDALLAATAECVRVLKPSGSLWVNLGDKYAGSRMDGSSGWATAPLDHDPGKKKLGALADSQGTLRTRSSVPTKSLIGIPWRYAIACIDQLGLILRAEVIWAKPNGLPESVTDRVRRSHETWFHFVKQPRYFSAVDEIREPNAGITGGPDRRPFQSGNGVTHRSGNKDYDLYNPLGKLPGSVWTIPTQPLKVPSHYIVQGGRTVHYAWSLIEAWAWMKRRGIAKGRLSARRMTDHFAAFPMEWPRRIIQGWSPSGVCTACGEGRRPVRGIDWSKVPHRMTWQRSTQPTREQTIRWAKNFAAWCAENDITTRDLDRSTGTVMGSHWTTHPTQQAVPTPEQWEKIRDCWPDIPSDFDPLVGTMVLAPVADIEDGSGNLITGRHNRRAKSMSFGDYGEVIGYACACPDISAPTTPAVVLDPFGGTGTVALVAKALGRHGISLDMSSDYCRLATWRTTDEGEYARALQVEKPAKQIDGQMSLLEGIA